MTKVTCVMLTTKCREDFARKSLRSFMRQTVDCAELLIINQGGTRIAGDNYRNVKEVFVEPFETIGEAREYALDLVQTPYIMHWDDDDYHGKDRVNLQLGQIELTGRPNTLKNMIICDLHDVDPFVAQGGKFGFVGLFCAKTEDVRKIGYPHKMMHEDYHITSQLEDLDVIDNSPTNYVRWYHGKNTCSYDHVFNKIGKTRKQLSMRERWYFNAVKAMYLQYECNIKCKTIEDIDKVVHGVPFMTYARALWLASYFSDKPSRRALEIGTCYGVGAAYLSVIFDHVDTLDLNISMHRAPNVWDTLAATQRTNVVAHYREPDSNGFPEYITGRYDFIFIDGDHSESGVRHDLQEAYEYLAPGGTIIMDDLDHPTYKGIRKVFDECTLDKTEYNGWGIIRP